MVRREITLKGDGWYPQCWDRDPILRSKRISRGIIFSSFEGYIFVSPCDDLSGGTWRACRVEIDISVYLPVSDFDFLEALSSALLHQPRFTVHRIDVAPNLAYAPPFPTLPRSGVLFGRFALLARICFDERETRFSDELFHRGPERRFVGVAL